MAKIENYQEECKLLYSLMTSGLWYVSFYHEDDPTMTEEFNTEHRWEIRRQAAPWSGKSGERRWFGSSVAIAYHNALKDIQS